MQLLYDVDPVKQSPAETNGKGPSAGTLAEFKHISIK